MTLLGIGNTIGGNLFYIKKDLFVDASLSLQGYDVMAVTGCFVGQMTNLLIGFSVFCIIGYARYFFYKSKKLGTQCQYFICTKCPRISL